MAGALEVASLFATIKLNDQLTGGLKTAHGNLSKFADGVKNFGSNLSDVGKNISLLTAPLAAFGIAGMKVASDFDSAMAEISGRTGLVGKDLEQIRQLSLKLGADTKFSAQDAADAYLNLLASGQSVKEAISTLPAVMDAAAASGEGLGTSADTLTSIMASFKLPAEQAGRVVDTLSRGAAASKATIASLGQGFANIGPAAKMFGLSVEDTTAILSIFEQNGIKGAEAGTQLRSMLTNMTRPTEKVEGAWKKLGVRLFDTAGRIRPINKVMAETSKALKALSDEDRLSIMKDIAGSYGQMGFAALTGSISIDQMKKSMNEAAGIQDVLAKKNNTFAFAVESLRGSIESLQINALTPLMDKTFKPMVMDMIQVVNGISSWITANPVLAESITKIATAIIGGGGLLFGVGKLVEAIGGLGMALIKLAPFVLPVLVIAGLISAYQSNFMGFKDWVDDLGKRLRDLTPAGWLAAGALTILGFALLKMALSSAVVGFPVVISALAQSFGSLLLALTPIIPPLIIIGGLFWAYTNNVAGFRTEVEKLGVALRTLDLNKLSQNGLIQGASVSGIGANALNDAYQRTRNNALVSQRAGERSPLRDSGGPVTGGQAYRVGVPELFVPRNSGTAIPLDKMGGGRTINFNGPLQIGAIATPEDVARAKAQIVDWIVEADEQAKG
jgi:TP901 family phage tail tape measure protein